MCLKDKLSVKAELDSLDVVQIFIEELLKEACCPKKIIGQVILAVEEVFVNIASYSYESGEGNCDIDVMVTDNKLNVIVSDTGKLFNPLERENPDITLSAEEREIGGLGIFMVKKIMNSVDYEYSDGKNILSMVKTWE